MQFHVQVLLQYADNRVEQRVTFSVGIIQLSSVALATTLTHRGQRQRRACELRNECRENVKLNVTGVEDNDDGSLTVSWRFSCILAVPWRPLLAAAGTLFPSQRSEPAFQTSRRLCAIDCT
jgi:hypothetical protein